MLFSDQFDKDRGKSFCNFMIDGEDDTIFMDHRWPKSGRPRVGVWFTLPDMMEFRCEFPALQDGDTVKNGNGEYSFLMDMFAGGEFEQTFKPVLSNGATIEQCEHKLMLIALHVENIS